MADIINLRTVRKAKARADKKRIASENRARHGESKGQKEKRVAEERLRNEALGAHKRED